MGLTKSPAERKAKAKDGCQLFYRIYPNPAKPRVVLIHSLALDTSFWQGVITELRGTFEILVYDCRGHGQSDRNPGPYSIEIFADDLAAVLEHCGWPAAIIAGCSMGGCVCQAFAAACPDRVQALMLIDTTAWYGPTAQSDWGARGAKAAELGFEGLLPFQIPRWFGDKFRAGHADLVEATSRVFRANDLACYQAACKMMGQLDLRRHLGSLRVPVSITVGAEDYATPLTMSESLHAAIPGSSLHVIQVGRHLTPIECPKDIAKHLRALSDVTALPARE